MSGRVGLWLAAVWLVAACAGAQDNQTNDPFPQPIEANAGVIGVNVAEFATIPGVDGQPPRMMLLAQEPGGSRLFVNDMRGPLYGVSSDGKAVTLFGMSAPGGVTAVIGELIAPSEGEAASPTEEGSSPAATSAS